MSNLVTSSRRHWNHSLKTKEVLSVDTAEMVEHLMILFLMVVSAYSIDAAMIRSDFPECWQMNESLHHVFMILCLRSCAVNGHEYSTSTTYARCS